MKKLDKTKIKLIYKIVCVAIVIVCFIPVLKDFATKDYPILYTESTILEVQIANDEEMENVGEILQDTVVEQTFLCTVNTVNSLKIYTQTYGRNNWSTATIRLIDLQTDEVLQTWTEDAIGIPDNDYLELKVDNPFSHDMLNKYYAIQVSSTDSFSGNCITTVSVPNQYAQGKLTINGKDTKRDMVFSINGYGSPRNIEMTKIFVSLIFIAVLELFANRLFGKMIYAEDVEGTSEE